MAESLELTPEMEALPEFERGLLGLIDDRLYDADELERYRRFAAQAVDAYVAGMARLNELAPDLEEILLRIEPVALVPYRSLPLAAVGGQEAALFLNVESFSTLDADEAAFTLGHEALHVRDEHYAGYRAMDLHERDRRRYAADILANDELLRRGFPHPQLPTMPTSALHGLPEGLSEDELVTRLPEAVPSDPGYYLRRLYPDEYPEGQIMKPLPKSEPASELTPESEETEPSR